ncbi:MAG TPA: type II toxin-antitoxin system PemK/MazF family toxin [Gemmataceae bacterium]|nr:type II toxin-antitoxin system PemK/MazF family toxin [Gemmataceae bacterium]
MNLGDICWFTPPPASGRVQQGRRPGIIWQDSILFPNLPTTLAIPLTSQQAALRFGGTHLIQPSARNKLAVPSVALVFQLAAVDVRDIGAKFGEIDDPDIAVLRELTRRLTGIP